MANNAPFTDQKIYGLVTGMSNAPFTDQRAVAGAIAGGGGTPGGASVGDVVYEPSFIDAAVLGTLKSVTAVSPLVTAQIDLITQDNPDSAGFTIRAGDPLAPAANVQPFLLQARNGPMTMDSEIGDIFIQAIDRAIAGNGSVTIDAGGNAVGPTPPAQGGGNILIRAFETTPSSDVGGIIFIESDKADAENTASVLVNPSTGFIELISDTRSTGLLAAETLQFGGSSTTPSDNKVTLPTANSNASAPENSVLIMGPAGTTANAVRTTLWQEPTGDVTDLEIDYDAVTSQLILSDPQLPVGSQLISQTTIVPGRTILIADVNVGGTNNQQSCIGLSNSTFPPPAAANLVGNNPPSVPLPPVGTFPTNWFPGATFRAIISGTSDFDNNDNLIMRIFSNRGQPTQALLNGFNLNLESTSGLGWKWTVTFTCRSVNSGITMGEMATTSSFEYTDDGSTPQAEGVIVSNVNSNFNTDVAQYLDFTFEFQQSGNSTVTNLCTIERIY